MSWPNLPPAYVTALQSQDVFAAPGSVISAIAGGGGPAPGPSVPTKAPTAPVVDGTPTETSIDILFNVADISGIAPIVFSCVYGTSSRPTTFLNAVQVSGNIWGATAPGLTAGTTYYFASRATNSDGYRESAVTAIATAGLSPVNQPPGVPIANAVTGTTITVSFTADGVTGSAPFNFQVVYGQTPTPAVTIPAIYTGIGTLFFAQITGLTSGATYYIATRVSNSVNSLTSATISVTTGNGSSTPPGLVPSMNLSAASVSSIGVYFDASSITGTLPISFSTLYGTTNPPQTPAIASLVSGTLYSTIINALPSSSTVYFDVQAGNAGGQTIGAVSAFSTLGPPIPPGGPPSAPGAPSVVSFTSTNNLATVNFDTAGQTGTGVSYNTYYGLGSNLPASALSTNAVASPSTGTIYTSQFGVFPGIYYTLASRAINGAGSTFSVSTTTYIAPVGSNGPQNVPNPTFVSATGSNITIAIDSAGVLGTQPISYYAEYAVDPTLYTPTRIGPGVLSTGTTQYIISTPSIATNQKFYFLSQASNAGGVYTQPASYSTGPFSTLNGAPQGCPAPTLVSAGQSSLTLALDTAGVTGTGPFLYQTLVGTSSSTATQGYQTYTLSTGTIYTATVFGGSAAAGLPNLQPGTPYYVGTSVGSAVGNSVGPVGGPFSTLSTNYSFPTMPPPQMLNSTSVTQVYFNSADPDIGGSPAPSSFAFQVSGTGGPTVYVPAVSLGGTSTLTATLPDAVPGRITSVLTVGYQNIPGSGLVSTLGNKSYTYVTGPPAPPTSIPVVPNGISNTATSILVQNGAPYPTQVGNGTAQYITRWGPVNGPFTTSSVMTVSAYYVQTQMNGLAPSTNYLVQNVLLNPLSTIAGPSTVLGTQGATQVYPNTPPAPLIYSISPSSLVFTVDGTGQPAGTSYTTNLQPGGWIVPGVARPSTSFYDFTYSTTVQLQPNINYTTTATATATAASRTGPASLPSQIESAPTAPPSGIVTKLPVNNPSTQIGVAFSASNIGSPTQVLLKYGLTPDYSSFSTVAVNGGAANPTTWLATASGLTPSTSYTFAPYLSNPLSSIYTQTPIPLSTQ